MRAIFGHEVPLGEAEGKLSALVDSDEATHDIITITRHGKPAAVLMSVDDLESLQETIYWLSRPAPPSRSRPPTAILLSADSQGRILGNRIGSAVPVPASSQPKPGRPSPPPRPRLLIHTRVTQG